MNKNHFASIKVKVHKNTAFAMNVKIKIYFLLKILMTVIEHIEPNIYKYLLYLLNFQRIQDFQIHLKFDHQYLMIA